MNCPDCDRLSDQAREALKDYRRHREVNRAATVRVEAALEEERRLKRVSVLSASEFRTHRVAAHPELRQDATPDDPDLVDLLYGGDDPALS
jgi:hypothetical protein